MATSALAATNLSSANFTAEIGNAGRLYVYPNGSTQHQCRTNGAGDNPSDLLAMYEVGGVPYVLGTKGYLDRSADRPPFVRTVPAGCYPVWLALARVASDRAIVRAGRLHAPSAGQGTGDAVDRVSKAVYTS